MRPTLRPICSPIERIGCMFHISKENVSKMKSIINEVENEDGSFSQLKLWKLKQKVCPRSVDPPMAKKDRDGNLITAPSELKKLYSSTYNYRLRNRKMKAGLIDVYNMKMNL